MLKLGKEVVQFSCAYMHVKQVGTCGACTIYALCYIMYVHIVLYY